MDIRQLKYFVSVMEHKSFTKAANALHVAQPALGLQIRKLEDELNARLMERHSRGVVPTKAGTILLERAQTILADLEAAKTAVRNLAPVIDGRVVVGVAPSISAMLSHSMIRMAASTLPNVSLVLVEELSPVLSEWLVSGRLDLAIGYDILRSSNVCGDPLLVEDMFLVQSPAKSTLSAATIPFSALANYELLAPCNPHALRAVLDYKAAELGIELNIRFEVQSVHVIKELVEQGTGATVLPYGAIHRECSEGRLVATKIVDPVIRRTAYLIYSARRPLSNAENEVVRLIRKLIASEAEPVASQWQSVSPVIEQHRRDREPAI